MAEFENTLVAVPGEEYDAVDVKPVEVPRSPNWNILDLINRSKAECPGNKKEQQAWINEQLAQHLRPPAHWPKPAPRPALDLPPLKSASAHQQPARQRDTACG